MTAPQVDSGTAASLNDQQLRQLSFFVAVVAFGEACFFSVLAPMLPSLADQLGISGTGAGVLAAAYPIGIAVATVPAGMAAVKQGPRFTARAGLAIVALSSVGFAFGSSPAALVIARFAQGVGAAVAWAGALAWVAERGAPEERGTRMGAMIAASFAGTIIAPVLALLTEHGTRAAVFMPVAVAFAVAAAWGGPRDEASLEHHGVGPDSFAILRNSAIAGVLWMMLLVGMVLGLLQSLGPLLLSESGVDDGTVALIFLAVYAPQVVITPALGRVIDRHGPTRILAAGLLISSVLLPLVPLATNTTATASLVAILTALSLGTVLPIAVWLSDLTEAQGEQQGITMAFFNGAWGLGFAIGAVASTMAAEHIAVGVPFAIAAGLYAAGGWWSSLRSDPERSSAPA